MSTPRDERYYNSVGKSQRTPPLDSQSSLFLQGQGGRTVLPPISSAFPNSHFPVPVSYSNQYTQPRSAPRYDYNSAVCNNQWPVNNATSSSQPSSFNYYDTYDNRYHTQPSYTSYPSRTPPAMVEAHHPDARKLPPLATSQTYGRDDRWNPSYVTPSAHIRSPTASYPNTYNSLSTTGPNYSYNVPTQTMIPSSNSSLASAMNPRSSSPYGPPHSHYSPPPVSPTSSEEPTVKKKRKRADAAQLKILTETYNRTAFPSTEERLELAKLLDMTPRSVQIWFQNRRQSMRQTRQSPSTQQAFTVSSQPEAMSGPGPAGSYDMMPLSGGSYMPGPHSSPTLTSAHRRGRSQETVGLDPHKQWSRFQ